MGELVTYNLAGEISGYKRNDSAELPIRLLQYELRQKLIYQRLTLHEA
jgi:hypothetical protein